LDFLGVGPFFLCPRKRVSQHGHRAGYQTPLYRGFPPPLPPISFVFFPISRSATFSPWRLGREGRGPSSGGLLSGPPPPNVLFPSHLGIYPVPSGFLDFFSPRFFFFFCFFFPGLGPLRVAVRRGWPLDFCSPRPLVPNFPWRWAFPPVPPFSRGYTISKNPALNTLLWGGTPWDPPPKKVFFTVRVRPPRLSFFPVCSLPSPCLSFLVLCRVNFFLLSPFLLFFFFLPNQQTEFHHLCPPFSWHPRGFGPPHFPFFCPPPPPP